MKTRTKCFPTEVLVRYTENGSISIENQTFFLIDYTDEKLYICQKSLRKEQLRSSGLLTEKKKFAEINLFFTPIKGNNLCAIPLNEKSFQSTVCKV